MFDFITVWTFNTILILFLHRVSLMVDVLYVILFSCLHSPLGLPNYKSYYIMYSPISYNFLASISACNC